MQENTITRLADPSGFSADPFTDVIRDGARKLIEQAIHAELATLMAAFSGERLEDGRARLVRHGHLPEREVMTGIGPVPVAVPRVRDRGANDDKVTFTPSILPRYLRKAKSVEELLPWLYLKGASQKRQSIGISERTNRERQSQRANNPTETLKGFSALSPTRPHFGFFLWLVVSK